MKKLAVLFLLILFLSGCATYKFNIGKAPYDKGYVGSRDGYAIPEYTVGQDSSVPSELFLAKERFKRRRRVVEHYYKRMGYIENRFRMAFWDPLVMGLKLFVGIFRLPSIAISDYKYERNAKYRERIRKIEEEEDAREEARINKLKEQLAGYIQKDLTFESQK